MDNGQVFPGALPEIFSGWSADQLDLIPGDGFWTRIEQIAVKGEMTRGLDTAMRGKSSPRIWLFLHEPGRGELSAAVAMSFARELAFRDQAALLLDGDDREQALTRWSGRLEAEGWIDLARYGTSVLTSGVPMPFVGRRGYFLGVGSFAPTDVTGEEVDTLITRLRRQADDLLIVAPADGLGRMWAPAASIRVLCWDRQAMPAEGAGAVADGFAEAGCPLTAVVSFQDTEAAEEILVDQVLAEVDFPSEESVSVPETTDEVSEALVDEVIEEVAAEVDEDPIEKPVEEPAEELAVELAEDPVGEPRWRDLPLEGGDLGEEQDADDLEWVPPEPEPVPETRGETSRVFWFGALAAVIIIAAIGVYYFKFVKLPSEGHFEQVDVVGEARSTTGGSGDGDQAGSDAGQVHIPSTAADDSLGGSLGSSGIPAHADSLNTVPGVGDEVGVAEESGEALETSDPETLAKDIPQDTAAGVGQETTPAETLTQPTEDDVSEAVVFDMGPYEEPVGSKGWALHVYSLPDSSGTVKQVRELDRRGFTSAVRIFDLGEKGRWRRIYLGSFASRGEAKEAMPALLENLRVDWAKAERFSVSAPE